MDAGPKSTPQDWLNKTEMTRPKLTKHKHQVTLALDPDTLEKAKKLADQCGMSLSKLVEIALDLEIVSKNQKPK